MLVEFLSLTLTMAALIQSLRLSGLGWGFGNREGGVKKNVPFFCRCLKDIDGIDFLNVKKYF